jgi:predicted transcriptional regulator
MRDWRFSLSSSSSLFALAGGVLDASIIADSAVTTARLRGAFISGDTGPDRAIMRDRSEFDRLDRQGSPLMGNAGVDEQPISSYSYSAQPKRKILMTTSEAEAPRSIVLAAEVVAAFVANNSLPIGDLPALIHSVRGALEKLGRGPMDSTPAVEKREPAVSIRKSITPDFLVCLDDGKPFKSLRRHLTTLGMTPDEYRAKWSLPADYPMVAPNYAAQRSEMAKKIGLGQLRKKAAPRQKAVAAAPVKRGRPAKKI